jgi:UDP-N-acetylglucosamine 1-carboxyvinyltransferase
MFQISYSPNLKWEVSISWSKNAALPIVVANYLIWNKIKLLNKPWISDIANMERLAEDALEKSQDFFDLTSELATKFRASILLIPLWLHRYGKVKFVWTGWCKIGKRPLDAFDDALIKAWITITNDEFKTYSEIDYLELYNYAKKNGLRIW